MIQEFDVFKSLPGDVMYAGHITINYQEGMEVTNAQKVEIEAAICGIFDNAGGEEYIQVPPPVPTRWMDADQDGFKMSKFHQLQHISDEATKIQECLESIAGRARSLLNSVWHGRLTIWKAGQPPIPEGQYLVQGTSGRIFLGTWNGKVFVTGQLTPEAGFLEPDQIVRHAAVMDPGPPFAGTVGHADEMLARGKANRTQQDGQFKAEPESGEAELRKGSDERID